MPIRINGEIGMTINETEEEGILRAESNSRVAVYLPGQSGGERVQVCWSLQENWR